MVELMSAARPCCICSSQSPKYKCPSCRVEYCSVACCKSHKALCSNNRDQSSTPNAKIETPNTAVSNEENFHIITDEDKKNIRRSTKIKCLVRSKRLQETLHTIDGADDRQQRLKSYRKNPEFEEFIQELLQIIKDK